MKKMKKILVLVLALAMVLAYSVTLTGCGSSDTSTAAADPTVKVTNGNLVGTTEDNGVITFKGIPYAKSPVGELRWKPAVAPDESDDTIECKDFGWTSLQTEWHSEPASFVNKKTNANGEEQSSGEDCLTLNVWTSDLEGTDKPVMVYIHGGGFGWGGTSDPLYSGKYLVEEHPDVIMVSCNYRVGTMGCLDLSSVKGYTDDYKYATDLEIMDVMQSLRWIKENIAAFGGDPENVTIFGESAGGALVSMALVADTDGNGVADNDEENLFQKCIGHSGCVNLTYTYDEFDANGTTWALCQGVANYKDDDELETAEDVTMDDLLALSSEDIYNISTDAELVPEMEGSAVSDVYNMPLRGEYKDGTPAAIPEDPYQAVRDGASKNVILIEGTNQDEWRYWTAEIWGEPILDLSEDDLKLNLADWGMLVLDPKIEDAKEAAKANGGDPKAVDKLMEMQTRMLKFDGLDTLTGRYEQETDMDHAWRTAELANETGFREPAIEFAEAHAAAGGTSYMYYFAKESDNFEWIGACHASELAYCFHNIEETIFSGTVDEGLADEMCESWTNFAKTGDPSSSKTEWTQYEAKERNTMTMDMDDDNAMKMVSDPLSEERELMQPFAKYYLK